MLPSGNPRQKLLTNVLQINRLRVADLVFGAVTCVYSMLDAEFDTIFPCPRAASGRMLKAMFLDDNAFLVTDVQVSSFLPFSQTEVP